MSDQMRRRTNLATVNEKSMSATAKPDQGVPHLVANLPLGFVATFSWTGKMNVQWEPATPSQNNIRSPEARRRLVTAYLAARDQFMRTVATVTGTRVLLVDAPGWAPHTTYTTYSSETTH
jgi:hypothetical protein